MIRSTICALHNGLMHRQTASASSFSNVASHAGQVVGKEIIFSVPLRNELIDCTICGITSPARSIITVSPSRISFSLMYSSLCMEMLETVTPPNATGCSLATGVTAPVRPT